MSFEEIMQTYIVVGFIIGVFFAIVALKKGFNKPLGFYLFVIGFVTITWPYCIYDVIKKLIKK